MVMSLMIHADPVPLRVDETGTIRVGKTRVTLDVFLADHRRRLVGGAIVAHDEVQHRMLCFYRTQSDLAAKE